MSAPPSIPKPVIEAWISPGQRRATESGSSPNFASPPTLKFSTKTSARSMIR